MAVSETPTAALDPRPAGPVPMDRLSRDSCGRISSIDVAQADLRRLEVMGICPGRLVHIVKQGDPLIVRVLDTRIGLAAALATFVYVRADEAE